MNLRRIAARTAVAGVTTALAAGALVGTATVAANAETGTATYNCTNPYTSNVIPLAVSVGADLSTLPPLPAGFPASTGSVAIEVNVGISEEVVQGLKENGITSVGLSNSTLALPFGSTAVPISGLQADSVALPDSGGLDFAIDATNGDFKLPDPGTQAVTLPTSFTINADTNLISLPLTCAIDGDAPTITSLTVIPQSSTMAVKKTAISIKKGKVAKIPVTVTGQNVTATGKVVAKEGKKTVGTAKLKKGKATVSIKGLKPGKHNIVLSYAGDKRTDPSNAMGVVVTVKKK